MRLGFLGCGTIASAVVRGLVGQGHQITVSERSEKYASALATEFAEVSVAANADVVAQSDILFLGLLAEAAPEILKGLPFREDQCVVSFMAGAALPAVAAMVHPAEATAIMLPFPGIATGGSPILALGETEVLSDLFEPRDQIFGLADQAELDLYLSAQAVLSPVALMLAEAGQWLGQNGADPKRGERFLRALVCNSLAATPSPDLISALNTPGGYNQRLRLHMEQSGLARDLKPGLDQLLKG